MIGELSAAGPVFDGTLPPAGAWRNVAISSERGELVLQSARLGAELVQPAPR